MSKLPASLLAHTEPLLGRMLAKHVLLLAEELVRKKIRDPTDFEWLKQCRFYWRDERDTVIITICDVDFEYSFEYLGARCDPAYQCLAPLYRRHGAMPSP